MTVTPICSVIPDRAQCELKWALEGRWSGKTPRDEFEARIEQLKRDHLDEQRGLVGAATDDYFLDQTLETAVMLGAVPSWAQDEDPFVSVSNLARAATRPGR